MSKMVIASSPSDFSVVGESSLHSAFMYSLSSCDSVERINQNHVIDGLVLGEFSLTNSAGDFVSYPQITSIPESARFALINPVTDNSSGALNSSFEFMNCVPFETSTTTNMNKCTIPPEVVAKSGTQLTGPIEWMINEHQSLSCDSPRSSRFSNEFSLHRNYIREEISSLGPMFLQAMQEILAEIALYALENTAVENGPNFPFLSGKGRRACASRDTDDSFAKKKHLLALLQLVDDQYNQCLHEIHTVSSAFHAVTELDPNLHARFALPTISSMYKKLRARIASHILPLGIEEEGERDEKSFQTCFVDKQWALRRDPQLWRPQRGLPERSVSVLRAWMFQNFLHPYPKDADKHLLALKSGLTRNQVSNWFINARVRLWKPMIEEMYAELNRRNSAPQ